MGAASAGLGWAALLGGGAAHGAKSPGSTALPVFNIRDYRSERKAAQRRLIRLRQNRSALIRNSRTVGAVTTFLSVEGEQSAGIALITSALRQARAAVAKDDGFAGDVAQTGNLSFK